MYVQLMLNGLSKLYIHVCIYAHVTILMKEFVAGRDTEDFEGTEEWEC